MLRNYFYNFLSYFVNLLLPLLYGSYIFKVFGTDINGKIAFVNTLIYYAGFISSFSLQSFALRELSKIRDNRDLLICETSRYLSFTFFSSVIVFIFYLLVSYLLIGNSDFKIYFSAGLIILGNGINIDYLYQVREDFKVLSIRSFLLKIFLFLLIYLFVKDQKDLVLYLLILSSISIVSNVYLLKRLSLNLFLIFNLKSFFVLIKKVWKFHIMNAGMILYNKLPSLIFIFSANFSSIGVFSFAEKFLLTSLGISSLLVSTFQPRIIHIKANNIKLYIKEYETLFILNIIILGGLTIIFFNISIYIQIYLGGKAYSGAVSLLKIGSILILISGTSNFITTLNLLADGKEGLLFKLSLLSATLSFPVMLILVFKFGSVGAILGLLASEFIMFILVTYNSLHRNNILQSNSFAYFVIILVTILLLFVSEPLIIKYLNNQLIFALLGISVYFLIIFIVTNFLFKSRFADLFKPLIS